MSKVEKTSLSIGYTNYKMEYRLTQEAALNKSLLNCLHALLADKYNPPVILTGITVRFDDVKLNGNITRKFVCDIEGEIEGYLKSTQGDKDNLQKLYDILSSDDENEDEKDER